MQQIQKIHVDDISILHYAGGAPCSPPRLIEDDIDTDLHFSKYWVPNPTDSYSITARGDSMTGALIFDGDMLVIDCSLEPSPNKIVVAWLNGDLTVKKLVRKNGSYFLFPENPTYEPIPIREEDDFRVLGVVTSVHRHL
jgi:DNA polymerase V